MELEKKAILKLESKEYELPIMIGTENERAFDIRSLRKLSGYVTFDDGYGNTAACASKITYIDGEKGILRYRGYAIEDLAKNISFLEAARLLIYGELPTPEELHEFRNSILNNVKIHTNVDHHFKGFPANSHPMAILSAMLNTLGCYYSEMATNDRQSDLEHLDVAAAHLISKVRTIAAMTYSTQEGHPFVYPKPDLPYTENFLHMMFSEPYNEFKADPAVVKALDLILLLHADHEQNCSTSTVRMVASGGANLFASVAAGVCALWGPLHGGANMAVVKMLEQIHESGDDGGNFIEDAKKGKCRLMGFGHRVYKNYDPRAKILGEAAEKVLSVLNKNDPLLNIARKLEEAALSDDYFISRKLYPNVDFYSGIILKAIGIPLNMFTVLFAIGRMPGWIANWKEIAENPESRIQRPRQIFEGHKSREFIQKD